MFNIGQIAYVNSMFKVADKCKIINAFPIDSEESINDYIVQEQKNFLILK